MHHEAQKILSNFRRCVQSAAVPKIVLTLSRTLFDEKPEESFLGWPDGILGGCGWIANNQAVWNAHILAAIPETIRPAIKAYLAADLTMAGTRRQQFVSEWSQWVISQL